MQERQRQRRATRALLAGAAASLAAAAGYAAATWAAGWTLRLLATVVGIVVGVVARAVGGPVSARVAKPVGAFCAATVVAADVMLGVVAVGAAGAFLDWQTAAWSAGAGFVAYLIAAGFDPLGVFIADPGARGGPAKEHLRGTRPCPTCGSLQTEPSETDPETGEPLGFVCNACDHLWQPPVGV